MYPLLKHLQAKMHYTLWLVCSIALSLLSQYSELDALIRSLFAPISSPKGEIVLQPDIVDPSKGSFIIRNPISQSPSFREWSVEIISQPLECSVDSIALYDHTGQFLSLTQNKSVTPRNDTLAIYPGTFIRADYRLNHGKLDDIIFSADGFATSLKRQEENESALKKKPLLIRIVLCLMPTIFLLITLYYKNKQIIFLRSGLNNAWKEIKALKSQVNEVHTPD